MKLKIIKLVIPCYMTVGDQTMVGEVELTFEVWRPNNGRTFEDVENLIGKILELFIVSLFDWACVWGFASSHYIGDFLESLVFSHSL